MKNNKSPLESISRVVPVLVPPAAGVPVVRHEALPVPASVCADYKLEEAAASHLFLFLFRSSHQNLFPRLS